MGSRLAGLERLLASLLEERVGEEGPGSTAAHWPEGPILSWGHQLHPACEMWHRVGNVTCVSLGLCLSPGVSQRQLLCRSI